MTNKSSISIEEAVRLIDVHVRPVRPKYLPLSRAVGRRAVVDLAARRPIPVVAIAAENGFGVWIGNDGQAPDVAIPREAPMIERDGPLPADVNALVPAAAFATRRGQLFSQRAVSLGDGIIPPGSVLQPGDVLIRAGELITLHAAYLAELAGLNEAYVRMPVIDVVFNCAKNPAPHDAFVRIVADEVTRRGSVLGSVQFAAGDAVQLADALAHSSADLLYVIGGTGGGPLDTTVPTLRTAGRLIFHGVRMDPGGTTSLAEIAGRPVLALPGCLPDMLAANAAITRHLSLKSVQRAVHPSDTKEARLSVGVPASSGRAKVYFGHLEGSVFELLDMPHSYSAQMARINGMILLPEGARGRAAGSRVAVMKLRGSRG